MKQIYFTFMFSDCGVLRISQGAIETRAEAGQVILVPAKMMATIRRPIKNKNEH